MPAAIQMKETNVSELDALLQKQSRSIEQIQDLLEHIQHLINFTLELLEKPQCLEQQQGIDEISNCCAPAP